MNRPPGNNSEDASSQFTVILPNSENTSEIDSQEKVRAQLRYGWQYAPPLSALLRTAAKAARQFAPSESGFVHAAISSQKRNPKTEYLRAFGHLLTNQHNFVLTTRIMQAIAVVASVVIDLPDVDVSYNDVRKALKSLQSAKLEDS